MSIAKPLTERENAASRVVGIYVTSIFVHFCDKCITPPIPEIVRISRAMPAFGGILKDIFESLSDSLHI